MKLFKLVVSLLVLFTLVTPAFADEPEFEDIGNESFDGATEESSTESDDMEVALRAAHFAGDDTITALQATDALQYNCPNGIVPTHSQVMADLKNHGQSSSGNALADGRATVVHTNASGLGCTYEVGFASYKKYDNVLYNQTLFDSMTVMVAPNTSQNLAVELPGCATQIDFFYGPPIVTFIPKSQGDIQYWSTGIGGADRKLGYKHIGGTDFCDGGPPPPPPGECSMKMTGLNGITDLQMLSGVANIEAVVENRTNNTKVVFDLTGPQNTTLTENVYPYYFFGDNGVDKPKGWNTDDYAQGDYVLSISVIDKATNTTCDTTDVRFSVGKNTFVELEYFTGSAEGSAVILNWETAVEIDNAGFNILRATSEEGPYLPVNSQLVMAEGEFGGATYSFVDAPGIGTFFYKLQDVDTSGTLTEHGPVAVQTY